MIESASLSAEESSPIRVSSDMDSGDGTPRPFALGQESPRPETRLAGLERIGERLAPRLRAVIEPFSRVKTQVTADPIDTQRFEEYREALPSFTSVSLYRLRPLKGGVLLVIDPDFIARLVDSFYGGSGSATRPKTKELTPTEERVLARVADGVVEKLIEAWADLAPLASTLASRETNALYANLARNDEAVVIQRFVVTPGTGKPAGISIVYPAASLRPYAAQLSAKVQSDSGPPDAEWRTKLAGSLREVRLPVRSVLARPELSVSQLMALKAGDVIPITLAAKVPLIVANRRIAHGTIGEQEGRAALLVEQVEGGLSGE